MTCGRVRPLSARLGYSRSQIPARARGEWTSAAGYDEALAADLDQVAGTSLDKGVEASAKPTSMRNMGARSNATPRLSGKRMGSMGESILGGRHFCWRSRARSARPSFRHPKSPVCFCRNKVALNVLLSFLIKLHGAPNDAPLSSHNPIKAGSPRPRRSSRCNSSHAPRICSGSVLIKSFNKPERNYFFSFARYSGRSFA